MRWWCWCFEHFYCTLSKHSAVTDPQSVMAILSKSCTSNTKLLQNNHTNLCTSNRMVNLGFLTKRTILLCKSAGEQVSWRHIGQTWNTKNHENYSLHHQTSSGLAIPANPFSMSSSQNSRFLVCSCCKSNALFCQWVWQKQQQFLIAINKNM